MPEIQNIRELYDKGTSISEIARMTGTDRKTIRKYVMQEDFSPKVPVPRKRGSKLDAYEDIIRGYLEEDKKAWRKQRHTAKRIYERLRNEHGYEGSYPLVARRVKKIRQQMQVKGEAKQEGYVPLEWEAGTAQVDFGKVQVQKDGELQDMHLLVLSFPYSNMGYAQLFRGETAECVCQGLLDIFNYIGGVPGRIIFDNATGIGRKLQDGVRLCELFQRFRLHYGFKDTFCNPYSGHEKGSVERKVSFMRTRLFIPVPQADDILQFNTQLLERSARIHDQPHYKKGENQLTLYEQDLKALKPLPPSSFNACRYEYRKTDKYGHIQVDGPHFYSTRPEMGGMQIMAEIGAHRIRILSTEGEFICEHERVYGSQRSESVDQSTTLALLVKKPGAWEQSGVRRAVSDPLQEYIDGTKGKERRTVLQLLRDLDTVYGFDTAVSALESALEIGRLSRDDVMILGARIQTMGRPADPETSSSLAQYDFLLQGGKPQC